MLPEKFSSFERSIAVVGSLSLGYGSALKYAGKVLILADVLKVGKTAEEVVEIAQATSKATEIIDSAKIKLGSGDGLNNFLDIVKTDVKSAG